MKRLFVLGHKHDLAATLNADLFREFIKGLSVCEVDNRIGLTAVAVASGNERHPQSLSQFAHRLVLCPRPETVDLECMDPTAVCPDKAIKQFIMPLFSYKFDIPQGRIQDHQDTRQFIEQSEHFGQPLGGMIFLIKGVTEERVRKRLCSGLR